MKYPIIIEEANGPSRSVVIIEAEDLRTALHIAADRLIAEYDEDGYAHTKVERDWYGSPWLGITIKRTFNNSSYDIEELTAALPWDSISDLKLER